MPRATLDLVPAAARSLRTILEISDHVAKGALRPEVARTVMGLFDLLAWSDGKLEPAGIGFLDRLCEEVPDFAELCAPTSGYAPTDPTFGEIPKLITTVADYDRVTGERLAPVLVDALETMGYAIIGAGGAPIDIEKSELHTYVNALRTLSRQLTTATPAALA